MKLKVFLLSFFIPLICCAGFWEKNFAQSQKDALKQKKLITFFFTGSDWSKRSQKEEKIFRDPAFQKSLKDSFIFCHVDFPKNLEKDKAAIENQKLKEMYNVEHFPSLVIVDPKYGIITKIDYLPLSLDQWKEIFQNLKNDIFQIKNAFFSSTSINNLHKAYNKAKTLHWDIFVGKLFEKGKKLDPTPFFLLEEYQENLKNKKYAHQTTQDLRKEIESRDPKNIYGAQLKIAVLDFQCLANQNIPSIEVITPLLNYIEMFKDKDRHNPWKLYLMISQYCTLQSECKNAVKYAREASKVCPRIIRKKILLTIKELKKLN